MAHNTDPFVGAEPRKAQPVSREAEAQRDLNHSNFGRGARFIVGMGFVILLGVGLAAAWYGSFAAARNAPAAPSGTGREVPPEGVQQPSAGASFVSWEWLSSPASARALETSLSESSVLVGRLRPLVQTGLVRFFKEGNTQAVVASDGWLFFQKDLDYVKGRPFLDLRKQMERREKEMANPDPVRAILDFHSQLAGRGIRFIFMPVPVKPCIEGGRLEAGEGAEPRLRQNASFGLFLEQLREGGVEVFDPAPLLFERRKTTGEAQYLARDTHWTPPAMQAVAQGLAHRIEVGKDKDPESPGLSTTRSVPRAGAKEFEVSEEETVTAHGDTVALLGLSPTQTVYPPETVLIKRVSSAGMLWRASVDAQVLLLGDSFSNIFSMKEMGWGEQAGLAEHLSAALCQPVDALLRNNDGAFATRQMLQQELAKGRDRLDGKTVVVWECAARELAFGDWKSVPLNPRPRVNPTFFCPTPGTRAFVEGTVARLSPAPKPGTVPYKEHIMSVLLVDLAVDGGPVESGKQCLVYTWSMRAQQAAKAAALRPGDRTRWEVRAWEEVQALREKFQRSEFDDPLFLAEPFGWAE